MFGEMVVAGNDSAAPSIFVFGGLDIYHDVMKDFPNASAFFTFRNKM
jgi:hypothetical protein